MKKFSQIISAVFSPLLVPTYAVALSLFLTVLALVPAPVKWTVAGVCFAITCLVPLLAIILLHKLGVVKDPGLNDRNERLIPYAVSAIVPARFICEALRPQAGCGCSWPVRRSPP